MRRRSASTVDAFSPCAFCAPCASHASQSSMPCPVRAEIGRIAIFGFTRRALARHVARGGEAHVLHLVARAELAPGDDAMLATDPEDRTMQRPLVAATRDAYLERFDAFRADLARAFRADGVVVHEIVDDTPPEIAVRRVVRPSGIEVAR